MKKINQMIEFGTDAGAFVMTCPEVANEHVHDEIDWFVDDMDDDFTKGRIAKIGLGGDGFYKVRATSGNLTKLEKKYAREVVKAGFECKNNQVFLGFIEALPGDGEPLSSTNQNLSGAWLNVDKGSYDVEVYSIDTSGMSDEDEYNEDNAADIVVIIKDRNEAFVQLDEAPCIFLVHDGYLFEKKSKKAKPKLGCTGCVKVYDADKSKVLSSKKLFSKKKYYILWPISHDTHNFPNSYSNYIVDIKDKSNIKEGDELILMSTEFDESDSTIYCEIIEKTNKRKGLLAKIKSLFKR